MYYYNNFVMPDHDVELTAVCYVPQYDNYGYDFDYEPPDVTPNDPGRNPYNPGNGSVLYPDYGYRPDYGYQNPDYGTQNQGGQWFDFDMDGVG